MRICLHPALPELLQVNSWFYQNYIEPVTENSAYPYLYLSRNGWMASIMEKLDEIYNSFGKIPAEPLSYFELMEDYFMLMKILYENLDIGSQTRKPESPDLSSLRSMMTYIEEHYMEHITLADIALSGACCKVNVPCSLKSICAIPLSLIPRNSGCGKAFPRCLTQIAASLT